MFIRTKKSSRNNGVYIQLVESYREEGRMKQRVIRHIGTAQSEEELLKLKQVALAIKTELDKQGQGPQQQISSAQARYARHLGTLKPVSEHAKLPLSHVEE